MNYWIITVKQPYCDYILRGLKKMEIRKSIPFTLSCGDIIFIVRKGEHGHIVGACRVTSIFKKGLSYFCDYSTQPYHRIISPKILEYAGEREFLYGIMLKRIELDVWCLNVRSFGYERPPQNFYRIRPEYKSTIDRVLNLN